MTPPSDGWDSLLLEVLRFGVETGSIQPEERYLVLTGSERARKYEMELTTEGFLAYVKDLRDTAATPGAEEIEGESDVIDTVTKILALPPPDRRRQIDLVVNHREIAALPFEAARATDGNPLLVGRDPPLVLTRRVRGAFRERTPAWPAVPRVLFAASSPAREIPLEEHKQAIRRALRPWIEPLEGFPDAVPDERRVLTVIEQASLAAIADACRLARYTHVHVLAHGCDVGHGLAEGFALEFAADDGGGATAVTGKQLAEAVCAGATLPAAVTVTACDSANVGSPVVAGSTPAHALHEAGVPVVVASQFPLTFPGSALVVEHLYGRLLAGEDVRDALLATRLALHDARAETGHDWMSLVAYAQLPEGYQDRLLDVRLAADLGSLRTAQVWADHLVEYKAPAATYEQVAERMRERMASLEDSERAAASSGRAELLQESRGLLGSANKRLAELLFRRAALEADGGPWLERSRSALADAALWYARAYAENLGAHWVAVQELSLEAVVHGEIIEPWRWHAAMQATRGPTDAMWKLGSRAELHLLAPYAQQPPQLDEARAVLAEFAALIPEGDSFPSESTARQLRRYVDWWTSDNGFFGEAADLREEAGELLESGWLP